MRRGRLDNETNRGGAEEELSQRPTGALPNKPGDYAIETQD